MLNKSVLVGRLTKDPAYFKKGDTIISTFCLAVERGYKSKEGNMVVDFIVCKAFGKLAYNIHQYTKKGQLIALTGQIQTRVYIKDDKKQYITEIICETIKFLNMPSTNRKGVPQSKEEISDLISESADTYSEELSVRMSDERNTAEQMAKENEQDNLSQDEVYKQYNKMIEIIHDETDTSEQPQTSNKSMVVKS